MAGTESKFCFFGHFLNREFIGQKALNDDNEKEIGGESVEEVLDCLWSWSLQFIKREALVEGDDFTWAELETPTRTEIDKFLVLQDQGSKKSVPITQVTSDWLRKVRGKHINVFVYSYGRKICNKSIHTKFSSKLLVPEKRDRANADNTVSLMEMVKNLKDIHSVHYSATDSSWIMWANHIQSAPANASRERMMNECPPAHLILLFRSVPISDNEKMRSTRNGLRITENMIGSIKGQLKVMRQDFEAARQSVSRTFEMMDWRLKAMEDVIESNEVLVTATYENLRPEENDASRHQESLIMDCEDIDHMN